MKMDIYDRLDVKAQLTIVMGIGEKVIELKDHQYFYELFMVDEFYVEIVSTKDFVLRMMRYFSADSEILDDYLELIEVPQF
ncbi:MAG: hypothetical protein V4556_05445 [Bacteroidota bacterium]